MNDGVVFRFEFEMRDVEVTNSIERRVDRPFTTRGGAGRTQFALDVSQGAQHASAIEALPFTMFAEAHTGHCNGEADHHPETPRQPCG